MLGSKGEVTTDPFIEIVTPKLHGRVRHNADAIRPIAAHEPAPALLLPHLGQALAHAELIGVAPRALDLEQDLEALERRHHGARHSARDAARAKGRHDRLGDGGEELVRRGQLLGGGRRRGCGRGRERGLGPGLGLCRLGLWRGHGVSIWGI